MTTCEFSFDRPEGVYYSGQQLNGKVRLVTNKPKNIRAVHIQINGNGKVRWEERRSRTRNNKTKHYTEYYTAHETYLSSRVYVVGANRGDAFELPAGVHEYTFSCHLPHELPTSFAGQYGHIRYDVELTIDRPLRFDNVFKQGFTIIRGMDLNMDPSNSDPRQGFEEKYFGCCCCASGPVTTNLSIPFTGYAPGQKINFTLLVDNEATNDVAECKVKFYQRITYKSHSPHTDYKHSTNEITGTQFGNVLRLSRKEFKSSIEVPAVPPSTLIGSHIISMEYYIKAKIDYGFWHRSNEIQLPVVIGTIPLVISATNPQSVITIQPTAPVENQDPLDATKPPPYKEMVPPTFEDALELNGKFKDHDDKNSQHQEGPFCPKYPVYYNFAYPSAPEITSDSNETSEKAALTSSMQLPCPVTEDIPTVQPPAYPSGSVNYGWTNK